MHQCEVNARKRAGLHQCEQLGSSWLTDLDPVVFIAAATGKFPVYNKNKDMLLCTVYDYAILPEQHPRISGNVHVYVCGTRSPQTIPWGRTNSGICCSCHAGFLHQGDFWNTRQFQTKMAGGVLCLVAALCVINNCLVQNPGWLML